MDNLDDAAFWVLSDPICKGITLDIIKDVNNDAMALFGSAYISCLMLFVCGLENRGVLSRDQWENMRDWNVRNLLLAHTN